MLGFVNGCVTRIVVGTDLVKRSLKSRSGRVARLSIVH